MYRISFGEIQEKILCRSLSQIRSPKRWESLLPFQILLPGCTRVGHDRDSNKESDPLMQGPGRCLSAIDADENKILMFFNYLG